MALDAQIGQKDVLDFEDSLTGLRAMCCKVLNTYQFDCTMCCLILLNLMLVILDTDHRVKKHDVPLWIVSSQYILLAIYMIECSIRAYTYQFLFFKSGWNILDLCIILVDITAEVLSMVASGSLAFHFSVFRTLRLIRVLRALRFLGGSKELWMMLHGLNSALKAIAWACVLIGLLLLIWAIVAVEILHPLNLEIAENTNAYENCHRCP